MDGNRFSRRTWLTDMLTLCTAGAARLPIVSKDYLVGCYTRPWDAFPLERALDGIAEAGYSYAGLMTAQGASTGIITPQTTEEEAARLGNEVRKRGLKVCSVYGDFPAGPSTDSPSRLLRRLIDRVAGCGSQELLLGGPVAEDSYEAYLGAITEQCDYAESKRVGLTIKPHGGRIATGAACRQAIERVRHANFRLWYDPGNVLYYSEGRFSPLRDVLEVDGLVVGMSVKDFRSPREVWVTPGTGEVNFTALFARLRMGGFVRGQLVVECTARGDWRQVTEEARKARVFVERLAHQRGIGRLHSGERPP